MKKNILFLVSLIFISFSTTWSQTIPQLSFRFSNPRIIYTTNSQVGEDCDNLEFDVDVKCDSANTRYFAIQVIMAVNATALDISTPSLEFTENATFIPYTKYNYNLNVNAGNLNMFITSKYLATNTTLANFVVIPTSYTKIGTFRLKIIDATMTSGIHFIASGGSAAFMDGQQSQKRFNPANSRLFTIPNLYDSKVLTDLYLGRMYSFSSSSYGWSQVGGSTLGAQYVSWSTPVNTSVWDINGSPAEINTVGSMANVLRIHPGAQLKINPGKDLTCTGDAEINGPQALRISSDASGTGTFIDNGTITYPSSGTALVERYLTACDVNLPTQGCWHYISPPISDALSGVFTGCWLQSYDETTGLWSGYITSTTQALNVMEGYIASRPSANPNTKLFTGALNTNCPAKSLSFTSGAGNGYNLTGNPYPSLVDLESSGITWTSVDEKVWYYSKYNKTYKPYVVGGPPDTNPGTRYAPAMQGFFVHATAAGSLTIPNGARTATKDTNFYKNSQSTNDVLWLTSTGPTGMKDETVVYFKPEATSGYDPSADCQKLWGTEDALQLYSTTSDGTKVTINALTYGGINTIVPVSFTIFTTGASGQYSLTASKFESFRAGTSITLEDKKANKTQELTLNPVYDFTYTDGDDPARFLLHFNNPYFGTGDKSSGKDLQIYSFDGNVYVKNLNGKPGTGEMFIFNIIGQELARKPVADIQLNKYTCDLPEGYYIIRVIKKDNTYAARVYLN